MTTQADKARRDAQGQHRGTHRTRAEWTTFAISAALILVVVGALVVEWAVRPSTPPAFRTTVRTVRLAYGKYQVPVGVKNTGNQSAGGVRVSARLELDREVTDAEEVLDFMAPGEETTVTFVFDRHPRKGRLSVSVRAFKEP